MKKRIAIITYNHTESSILLAKYLSLQKNIEVDLYCISSVKEDSVPGFDFKQVPKTIGFVEFTQKNSSELLNFLGDGCLHVYLFRMFSKNEKYDAINKFLLKYAAFKIKKKNYDFINIIGQDIKLLTFYDYIDNVKITHTLHEVYAHYDSQKISDLLLNYLHKNRIQVIVHSEHTYVQITSKLNFSVRKVTYIPFGLFLTYQLYKVKEWKFSNISDGYILFYGLIRPYKGLGVLNQALSILDLEGISYKVVVAGSGFVEELNLLRKHPSVIVYNQKLTNQEIYELNVRSRFVLCPYTSASQSGIVSTTFALERPIVASRVGAFSESIIDSENGILVNANDPQDLANAIKKMLISTNLYLDILNGVFKMKEKAETEWSEIATKTYNVYLNH